MKIITGIERWLVSYVPDTVSCSKLTFDVTRYSTNVMQNKNSTINVNILTNFANSNSFSIYPLSNATTDALHQIDHLHRFNSKVQK